MSTEKRNGDQIALGSGHIYAMPYTETMPTKEEICVEANRLGRIKGGCTLEYTGEFVEEKDDLGLVSKILTSKENATLKCGLITWNGDTAGKIIDRCDVVSSNGLRTTSIGGVGNAQGKVYTICFHHEDKKDGDIWIMMIGVNTNTISLAFMVDSGTVIEPTFKAMPQDEKGTLVKLIEETTPTPAENINADT